MAQCLGGAVDHSGTNERGGINSPDQTRVFGNRKWGKGIVKMVIEEENYITG